MTDEILSNTAKGRRAIKELYAATDGISRKSIIIWLARQALWQVFQSIPKHIRYPHYEIRKPNKMHQVDVIYLTHDKLYGNIYKYGVCVEDAASRYKVARPLRTKKGAELSEMLADIYKKGPLKYPEIFQCDNGGECKGNIHADYWKNTG